MKQSRPTASPILVLPCLVLVLALGSSPTVAQPPPPDLCERIAPVDDGPARAILASERPFSPADKDLFFASANPDWADAAPYTIPHGPALDEEQTRAALRSFLETRFPCSPQRVLDGLAVYGDPIARQKVPEPTLRAALAALVGTLGEPAIPYVLYASPVTAIHFGIYWEDGQGIPWRYAGSYQFTDGTAQIVFDRIYRFLPFSAFSALLFHEILHTGFDTDVAGLPEEAAASALEALVYMQTLLVDPALAELPDDFTRSSNNHLALVRLNSGPAESDRLTLFVPGSEVNIDPLAIGPITQFYDYYAVYSAPDDPDFAEKETSGNRLLRWVLRDLAESGSSPPPDANFDRATLEFIDQNQAVLSPTELIAVACILRLDVPCEEEGT